MAITRSDAEMIANRQLQEQYAGLPVEAVILGEQTEEHDIGWVFYYDSRQFLDTANPSFQMVGNEPLVVDRQGQVHWLPTGAPPDESLAELRAELNRS